MTEAIAEDIVPWPEGFARRYRENGLWQGRTFDQRLLDWAEKWGPRLALVDDNRRLTYRELAEQAHRLAAGLHALGLRKGDHVILQLPNAVEFMVIWFACQRIGVIPIHAMPGHRRNEVGNLSRLSDAVAYFIPDRHGRFDYRSLAEDVKESADSLRHIVVAGEAGPGQLALAALEECADAASNATEPPEPSDIALLLLSGGTTGLPKLIPRTHDDYAYNAHASAVASGISGDDVYLAVLPIGFNFTFCCPGVLGTLANGGKVVLSESPDPATAFRWIQREGVTVTSLSPPLVPLWLSEAEYTDCDLSSLRLLQVGGARLADELAPQIETVFNARVQQVFGMAEGLVAMTRPDDPAELRYTTQGRPISPYDEVRIVDEDGEPSADGVEGELYTRGPYTLRGYYRAPEYNAIAFTHDGYYRTGDIVQRFPSGHLAVVGRTKEQINRGGEKITTREVEDHLLAHPEVEGAAVLGIADRRRGERSVAFVATRSGRLTAADLAAFLRERGLAAYKFPDQVEVVDSLPLTTVGKVDKNALRESLRENREQV